MYIFVCTGPLIGTPVVSVMTICIYVAALYRSAASYLGVACRIVLLSFMYCLLRVGPLGVPFFGVFFRLPPCAG